MTTSKLQVLNKPALTNPCLLLGLSGWMDSGQVSTGTINCLIERLNAKKFAQIEPEGFYIYSFPGSMELTSLFRPHTKIEQGLITACDLPTNTFYACEEKDLILLSGREPNINWNEFAQCIFSLCTQFGVKTIYFIGSVAGLVPHTREPRLFCSVSDPQLKETLQHYGVNFANYEGPASIVTYMTANCHKHGLRMASLVATVPAYVQGNNPKCTEAVTKRLAGILDLEVKLDDLREISDRFEKRLGDVVQSQPELATNISKLEEDYDNEIFDSEMGELKQWLQQQGIRLD
ncbi:MAG: PAC2 family protein [Planctomycetota bacterium]|jgi:proteasome assembly chaperone (PAC2) family protein